MTSQLESTQPQEGGRMPVIFAAHGAPVLLDDEVWVSELAAWAKAMPTWEHYAPVLVAAGAVADEKPKVTFPITGWWMDSAFTKRSVQFG